jgi:hypothetical protein
MHSPGRKEPNKSGPRWLVTAQRGGHCSQCQAESGFIAQVHFIDSAHDIVAADLPDQLAIA